MVSSQKIQNITALNVTRIIMEQGENLHLIKNVSSNYSNYFRCAKCSQYVEGEVVSALGNTFHQKCFTCAR